MDSFETVPASSFEVSCDGGGGPLGHPRVYLHVDPDERQVVCPYCSRTFLLSRQEQDDLR